VAKFSPQAQAAYAFVSAIFASLYDHMPVYTAEPSGAERAAAAVLLEQAVSGACAADVLEGLPVTRASAAPSTGPATGPATGPSSVPSPRLPAPGERIPA
jgi:hypothetical protein